MTGALNMGANLVSSVADPVAAQDVATKAYVDAADATKAPLVHTHLHTDITDFDEGVQENRLDQLAAPTAPVDMNL